MTKGGVISVQTLSDDAPIYNFMSSLVSCPDTGYVVLFGGFDELDNLDSNVYLLNVKTMNWEIDEAHDGLYREGHLAVYIGKGNILVFGGIPNDINGLDDQIQQQNDSTSVAATGVGTDDRGLDGEQEMHNMSPEEPENVFLNDLAQETPGRTYQNSPLHYRNSQVMSGGPVGVTDLDPFLDSRFPRHDTNFTNTSIFPESLGSSLFLQTLVNNEPHGTNINLQTSVMLIYNVFTRTWIGPPPFTLVNAPPMRSRHACCLSLDGTKVYISGGLVDSEPLNDLWIYDLVVGQWLGPIEFVSRFHHSIVEYNGKLYAFGGMDKDMNHVSNNSLSWIDLKFHTGGELVIRLQQQTHDLTDESKFYQHYYLDVNPSTKLDVAVPLISSLNRDFDILAIELGETRYTPLIQLNLILSICKELHDYRWRQAVTMNENLYILGTAGSVSNANSPPSTADKLQYILPVKLSELGIVARNHLDKRVTLSDDFKRFFLKQEYTDFAIVTLANESSKAEYNQDPDTIHRIFLEYQGLIKKNELENRESSIEEVKANFHRYFKVVHVHKAILLARWDHFERLMTSGMKEATENVMFVPEVATWVKGMLYYLYTDTVEFGDDLGELYSIVDYSGMLVLSNVYSLPKMRLMVLQKLYQMTNVLVGNTRSAASETIYEVLIKVWENVNIANEPLFLLRINPFFRDTWAFFIRTNVFKELPKGLIILLCQQCSEISGNDPKIHRIPGRSTPEPELLRAMNVSPETPMRMLRLSHPNLPFLKD